MNNDKEETTHVEITNDPTSLRSILWEIINALKGPDGKATSRENALAITKLQEARFWLGEGQYNPQSK